MERKQKQLWILLGILLLLLAGWLGLRKFNQKQEEEQEAKGAEAVVYATDLKNVEAIRYEAGEDVFSFEKQDGNWTYTQDPDFPLKQSFPEGLVLTFGKLTADRELSDGDKPEDYGLTEPAYTVWLRESGGEDVCLNFGNMTGDCYYMRNENTGKIYTVSSTAVQSLDSTLESMAQLDEYPNISSGNLKKEVIRQNGKETVYDSENEEDELHIASVAGGLGAVSLDTAADYSVEDEALSGFGLDGESRITVEATYTEQEEEKLLTLYIGKEDGNGNRYVMINESRIIYLIKTEVCNNILNVEE